MEFGFTIQVVVFEQYPPVALSFNTVAVMIIIE
jgi:hypothetical protein